MTRRLLLALLAALACGAAVTAVASARSPIPMFAYYYIWYSPSSWDRAKRDYPLLGRYSSDDVGVLRTHVSWAKDAGIDAFLVSWKDTPQLDERLAKLAEVARAEHFKLGIVYQGLDFYRRPRAAADIAADLDYFVRRFGKDPVFHIYGRKPLVIWSGTWKFTPAQVASVTDARRRNLLILASEKRAQGYERLAGHVDGDGYYWSSVNPSTFPGYQSKLNDLSTVVHRDRGLWIAPAAPGFDARMIGGTTVVPRRGGATLRTELDAATASAPDAIGLISWNEFSENSAVEPSRRYGRQALQVLAKARGARVPAAPAIDSSDPGPAKGRTGAPVVVGLGALLAAGFAVIARRNRRRPGELG
jgi:hypothetical protein